MCGAKNSHRCGRSNARVEARIVAGAKNVAMVVTDREDYEVVVSERLTVRP